MTKPLRSTNYLAALATVMACCAAPVMAAQSSAYGVAADLTTDGNSHVQLPSLLLTSGVTALGQSYNKPLRAAILRKSIQLVPSHLRGPYLSVVAQKLSTDAAGANAVDALNTSGTASSSSGVVTLTIYPPLPVVSPNRLSASAVSVADDAAGAVITPVPPLGLSALIVQFSELKASANYDQILPGPVRRSGSTSFGKLILSGPLVGSRALIFSGEIATNTVALNMPTVKITLNAQSIPQQPVCPPNAICPLYRVLETVETKAVLIELKNAPVLGHQVSGDIVIGDAEAGQ